jgi:hypothetical protein
VTAARRCVECRLRPWSSSVDGLCDLCAGTLGEELDDLAGECARAVALSDWHAAASLARDGVQLADRVAHPGRDGWRGVLRGVEVVIDVRRLPGSRELAAELVQNRDPVPAKLPEREKGEARLWEALDTAGHRELNEARALARGRG